LKLLLFVSCLCLLLCSSCTYNVSQASLTREKKVDGFRLFIETNNNVFNEDEEIAINSLFEYTGENEIEFNNKPTLTIVVRNDDTEMIVRTRKLTDLKSSMSSGDSYSAHIEGLSLEKGRFSIYSILSTFSVNNTVYSLSTAPIHIEVS
jgi:hypothetical protein